MENEDLLARALDGDALGGNTEAFSGDTSVTDDEQREIDRVCAFAERARATMLDEAPSSGVLSEMRERALIGRILARTTREDPSWRGEMRLVMGFLRERLSASPLLRVVAASLVLHIAAAPVLALYLLREAEAPGIEISIVPRAHALEDEEPVVDPPAEAAVGARGHDDLAGPRLGRIENALRRARYVLTSAHGPTLEVGDWSEDASSLERNLLAARSRFLAQRAWSNWLDETERWMGATTIARVLWVELWLDRLALEGVRSPRLAAALNDLALMVSADTLAPGSDLDVLLRSSLDRARSYGAWEASVGFDPMATSLPLESGWFETLNRALESSSPEAMTALELFSGWKR